jgi:hypothetical protein
MCVWIVSTVLPVTFFILRRTARDVIKMYARKVTITLAVCNCSIPNRVSKNNKISNFIEIRSVGAELFHADRRRSGQRDRHDEANSRFLQFRESA